MPGGGTEALLYGEVQKEVIAERLAIEHGVEASFAPSRIICVERPVGVGEAIEEFGRRGPALGRFWATVGLRVAPAARDTGVVFRYETELGASRRPRATRPGGDSGAPSRPVDWTRCSAAFPASPAARRGGGPVPRRISRSPA